MNIQRNGISSPDGSGVYREPPAGHTKVCFAGAVGRASRGGPPEDFAVTDQRARELLAGDPEICKCQPANKGIRGRRQR